MSPDPCVYIVDDDPAAAESVHALVSSRGVATQVFSSADEFLKKYRGEPGGCLVTDVRMPGMSGLELQETLAQRKMSIPVILITAHGDVPSAVKAMTKGAIVYLEKPPRERELWSSIKTALSRASRNQIDEAERASIQARVDSLKPGELAVMRKLYDGVTNKQMVNELKFGLRTVELHRQKLFEKMNVDNIPELIRLIIKWGGFSELPDQN